MSVLVFFTPEHGTDRVSQNIGKKLPYSLRNDLEEHSFHVSLCLDQTVLMTTSYDDLISVYMSIHIPVVHMHTCHVVAVCSIRKVKLDFTSFEMLCA